ncbi:murein hydrolase activator EnvC family protein [Selenomonas ruminis]|uniref:murein hydrolase activator EnvC family protein n=1 Tax=Selenomonas ruminis TaxID=2593411 RepID=UPI003F7000C1
MKKKTVERMTAAMLAVNCFMTVPAQTALASLEDDKADYERKAEQKKAASEALSQKLESLSEEKRLLDEEAEAAINEHKKFKEAFDETTARMADNEVRLKEVKADYEVKSARLAKRVRDIYINGQISYLDVLFGAKDFSDFMTRMDLLKKIIRQDYDLVHGVLDEKKDIEATQASLEKDKKIREEQELKARQAKQVMEEKVRRRQELIDKMKSDKATVDREYDELMAASKQIALMLQRSSMANLPVSGDGSMIWPVGGTVTSEFGWRTHPISGTRKYHSGIDIGADYGTPIAAAQSGTVEYAGWISGYGNTVIINHGGGITTLYGHNQSLAVSAGQQVSQGETIAYCGSTGNSTGPHCHFEVRSGGEPVSPYNYL